MAWTKVGSTTVGSGASDNMDLTSITLDTFNDVLVHKIGDSTDAKLILTFNDTGGTNYAYRYRVFNTEYNSNSQASISMHFERQYDDFAYGGYAKISGGVLFGIYTTVSPRRSSGVGTVPDRQSMVFKYAQTADVTRTDLNSSYTTTAYAENSNYSLIGSDGATSLNVQDGAIYYDTTLNKEYVLNNNTWTEL
tara:strand:+ start:2489 stop:3067 length:579 start_codon:yes stop_codon:yes gene_type:complete